MKRYHVIAFLSFALCAFSEAAFGQACVPSNTQGCTPNIQLALPVANAPNWNLALNQNSTLLDQLLSGNANLTKLSFSNGTISGNVTLPGTITFSGFLQLQGPFSISQNLWISPTAPTISSGFGTSPSIVNSNGSAVFEVNVGTGGSATSGVIGLPVATNGWGCLVQDMNTNIVTRETAFTATSATLTAASAWTASDKLIVQCEAF
jgi:hypothetical protein